MRAAAWFPAAAIALAFAAQAVPAAAENYDVNCNRVETPPDDIDIRKDIAEGWLPIGLGLSIADKGCQGVSFLDRIFSSGKDLDEIGPNDVFEASKPYGDEDEGGSSAFDSLVEAAGKRFGFSSWSGNPAGGADAAADPELDAPPPYLILPPAEAGGSIQIVEPRDGKWPAWQQGNPNVISDINGNAVLLTENGIERGNFLKGELDGQGEEITEYGTWRGGTFKGGEMEGQGFEFGTGEDGKPYLMEGQFKGDLPDGMVNVTFNDGSSQRNLWRGGEEIAEGKLAAAGQTPVSPSDPDGPWTGGKKYRVPSNIEAWLNVVTIDGKTYLTGDYWDGKRDGMMQRIFADGTVQYEEWQYGSLLQVGQRGEYSSTITPQPMAKAASAAQPAGSPGAFGGVGGLFGGLAGLVATGAVMPAETSAAGGSAGGSMSAEGKWSSVCMRNSQKITDFAYSLGSNDTTYALHDAYARLFAPCRGSDPEAERIYQMEVGVRDSAAGNSDRYPDKTAKLVAEVNRALADPNYSAELGSVRGGGAAAMTGAPSSPGRCPSGANGAAAFDAAFNNLRTRYPLASDFGARDTYQHSMFLASEGLKLLAQQKDCMGAAQYESNRQALQTMFDSAKTGCVKLSSDGGTSCLAQYPRRY